MKKWVMSYLLKAVAALMKLFGKLDPADMDSEIDLG